MAYKTPQMMAFENISKLTKKVKEVLKDIPISSLLTNKRAKSFHPLIAFHELTSVEDVLKTLSEKNILSAPVYSHSNDDDQKRIYTGIISVYDILSFSVFQDIFDSKKEFNPNSAFDYIDRLHVKEFFKSSVKDVIGVTTESANPWIVYSSDPVSTLIDLFSSAYRQHRALVVDSEVMINSLIGPIPTTASLTIVTQTDLVQYLVDSLTQNTGLSKQLIEPIFNLNMADIATLLCQDQKPIIAMLESQTTLHGLRTLYLEGINALPVINKDGNVVGTLSTSDLRGMTTQNIASLKKPVLEYLKKEHRLTDTMKANQIKTIGLDGILLSATKIMLASRIHRVWITVNGETKLAGVLTLTDVISLFKPLPTTE